MARRVIIPARLASTRLPDKPLLDIAGKPMIQRVYERAAACEVDSIAIATDDQRVYDCARAFGATVVMTEPGHPSGTERLGEAVRKLHYEPEDLIVNIQGDEPLLPAALVTQVLDNLAAHPGAAVATLCEPITTLSDMHNPNCVKVVTDCAGYALYFSRAAIPWHRDCFPEAWPDDFKAWRHVGMYAYRAGFLRDYTALAPSEIENWESLEQLRLLWHGYRIHVARAMAASLPGVDTEADLERVRAHIEKNIP